MPHLSLYVLSPHRYMFALARHQMLQLPTIRLVPRSITLKEAPQRRSQHLPLWSAVQSRLQACTAVSPQSALQLALQQSGNPLLPSRPLPLQSHCVNLASFPTSTIPALQAAALNSTQMRQHGKKRGGGRTFTFQVVLGFTL